MTALLGGEDGDGVEESLHGDLPHDGDRRRVQELVGVGAEETGRVLAHRERSGGFKSADELDEIPGFPADFLAQIKSRLTT